MFDSDTISLFFQAIICGHSLEVNATSDVTFYISTQHVCLMQTLLEENLQPLTQPAANPTTLSPPENTHPTSHLHQSHPNSHPYSTHPYQSHPAVQYRKPLPLEDSGLGSEESLAIDITQQLQQLTVDVGKGQPKSLHSPRPVMIKPKLMKRTSTTAPHYRPSKPKSKRLTPSDILFTAGRINVYLYSTEFGDLPSNGSGSPQHPDASDVTKDHSTDSRGKIHPFLHLEVSQPSAIASLERHQQKVEFSIYDLSLDGASVRNATPGN